MCSVMSVTTPPSESGISSESATSEIRSRKSQACVRVIALKLGRDGFEFDEVLYARLVLWVPAVLEPDQIARLLKDLVHEIRCTKSCLPLAAQMIHHRNELAD